MDYIEICDGDYSAFCELANAYYREGEDADTPQAVIDAFIRLMFGKVANKELRGCFVKDQQEYAGFALWVVDSEDFEFSQMPGLGTILEIGLTPDYRSRGLGKSLVTHIEKVLREQEVTQCYVSAYGPAQKFWLSCGYVANGEVASNGLPIMVKNID